MLYQRLSFLEKRYSITLANLFRNNHLGLISTGHMHYIFQVPQLASWLETVIGI